MINIRIFDDYEDAPPGDEETAKKWKLDIEEMLPPEDYTVELVGTDRIEEQMKILEKRRTNLRKGEPIDVSNEMIDTTDLLIVDFDLLYLKTERSVSGEDIAYLARCFSKCGLIIGVNRFKKQGDFNLNLFSPLDSYADYDVQGKWLADPGLWFPDPVRWNEFRPWYWPALTTEIENFRERVKQAEIAFDDCILDTFNFPTTIKGTLPRVLGSFLEGSDFAFEVITFKDFVQNSPNALRGKETDIPKEYAARIAAARIHAWLERALLPRLDILVDTPHLVEEYASLLRNKQDIQSWNLASHLISPGIDTNEIADQEWKHTAWLSRRAWWRDAVAKNQNLAEVRDPWPTNRPNYVFCEDSSRFRPKTAARRFVSDTTSGFAQRYVTNGLEGISYSPAVRLAM